MIWLRHRREPTVEPLRIRSITTSPVHTDNSKSVANLVHDLIERSTKRANRRDYPVNYPAPEPRVRTSMAKPSVYRVSRKLQSCATTTTGPTRRSKRRKLHAIPKREENLPASIRPIRGSSQDRAQLELRNQQSTDTLRFSIYLTNRGCTATLNRADFRRRFQSRSWRDNFPQGSPHFVSGSQSDRKPHLRKRCRQTRQSHQERINVVKRTMPRWGSRSGCRMRPRMEVLRG